jgi:hypothetical protein
MKTFGEFVLAERFVNLLPHHEAEKEAHKHEVYGLMQKSYEKIGGIHGSGFKDADDMVKNIPMWKLHKRDGKVHAAVLYKDKGGRKSVAVGTDGSDDGKEALKHVMKSEIEHGTSYKEVSGPSLSFMKRHTPDLHHHAMDHDEVKHHLGDDDPIRHAPDDDPEVTRHPEFKDHFYQRKIGDHWHTKVMLGKAGNTIK